MLSCEELSTGYREGLRKGNWRELNLLDKAFFRASLWYTKHRGSIVNASLVEKLSSLVEKLKEAKGMQIFERRLKKARELFGKIEEMSVFTWMPQLKYWLKDPDLYLLARNDALKLGGIRVRTVTHDKRTSGRR